jgi:hypothetical protein
VLPDQGRLDGVELGQLNSYITSIKWVSPSGTLEEASTSKNPEKLPLIRASYGLAGVVYEVTFTIKPLEIVKFDYHVHKVEELTDEIIAKAIASNQTMVMWTIDDDMVIQTRNAATELKHEWLGNARRFGWNFLGRLCRARTARTSERRQARAPRGSPGRHRDRLLSPAERRRRLHAQPARQDRRLLEDQALGPLCLHLLGVSARRLRQEPPGLREVGRRLLRAARLPLQHAARVVLHPQGPQLAAVVHVGRRHHLARSHSRAGRERAAGVGRFPEGVQRVGARAGGIPLLNQSPFVRKAHVISAYGERWTQLADWLKTVDPSRRMVNEFFGELLP